MSDLQKLNWVLLMVAVAVVVGWWIKELIWSW